MEKVNQDYCLILAGGVGSRLWPLSSSDKPKQFQDFFGTGRTLLQQTYDRFASFMQPDHIYISTTQQYLPLVQEQLPEVSRHQIIAEPLRRGTLASVALGALIIAAKRDAQANVICTPADQWITDDDVFQQDMRRGLDFVAGTNRLLTIGLKPTRPETEYGYIQMGEKVGDDFYRVKSFTEKPAREYANVFLQTDEFLWNVGLFLFNVQTMLRQLTKQVPAYEVELPRMMAALSNSTTREVPEFFSVLPNLNVDYGILDKNENGYVQQARFGWVDLGTWVSLQADVLADKQGNLVLDADANLYNCHGNIIRLPQGHKVMVSGLTDFVIAEENGVLMICPKHDLAMMRRMRIDSNRA